MQRRGEELEWMAGCPSRSFAPWVRTLAAALDGAPPGAAVPAAALQVAVLNAELRGLGLAKAAQQGLPADWVTKLTLLDPHRRQARPPLPILPPLSHRFPALFCPFLLQVKADNVLSGSLSRETRANVVWSSVGKQFVGCCRGQPVPCKGLRWYRHR